MNQFWTVALISTVFTSLFQVAANAATFSFSNPLSGSQQVPPNASPATGFATSILNGEPTSWTFNYDLSFSGLSGPLALAHIHLAPAGQAGPVVHDLDAPPLGSTSGKIVGDWTSTEVVAAGIDPVAVFNRFLDGQYYFNVHSNTPGTNFRAAGEIRGQIEDPVDASAVPEPSTMLGLLATGAVGSMLKRRREKQQKLTSDTTRLSA
ncbi:PEP-CTERM sorting domain-containing protein [Phormidium sp. CLA17]|uniref:PEP-CTERM sorting domain-containing protein n=1 Tax=Leptolyngbya sp. Cla-17 TaxID=2803751 RepID=UPI001492CAFF|nr:PEP-CTERM sorting domain-containing protein [Leptolyngbya sp. Cla-17]MBM0741237.1 PEP-CTERM sorting domain-containing protein [Leptolyngbya sp. Cla-17]